MVSRTWRETEWVPVIIEDMLAGILVALAAALLKICQWDEFKELVFLIIGTAILGFAFGFIYRLIFITPEKIYKEFEKRLKTCESKLEERGDTQTTSNQNIEDKATQPTQMPVMALVCLCVGLAFLLVGQISKNHKLENQQKQPEKIVSKKPLPTKVIPRPEAQPSPMIIPTQQVAVTEPIVTNTSKTFDQFDSTIADTNDTTYRIQQLREAKQQAKEQQIAEQNARAQRENQARLLDIKKWWDLYLPYYNHSLVVLHDALLHEAAKEGDGIAQSNDYFQSLPSSIAPSVGGFNVAEIRFQKSTNMDFIVSVTALNSANRRTLRIISAGGFIEMELGSGDKVHGNLHIEPDIDLPFEVATNQANTKMVESVNDLIGAEILFLQSRTNDAKIVIQIQPPPPPPRVITRKGVRPNY